jgi:tetratricopeptide (TPR) repeat protein
MLVFFTMKKIFRKRYHLWVCLFLIGAVLIVYSDVKNFDFIIFDDTQYVTGNRHVQLGLTAENISWSFRFDDKEKTYWHPLTWISHMLDVELFGMKPGHHHLGNVFFHMASTLLLFLALHRMTGALWRSAFVAALFAVHPINVESVAWIAERKNVLSTFFWMLTLLAYAYYHGKPGMIRYLILLFVFALGLLAKPMLVTLPLVLLLLDYWPLSQNSRQEPNGIFERALFDRIAEKVPLLVLSGLSVYLASSSLRGLGNYIPLESIPMTLRIENALVSYIKYIGKMIWPANLAVFYPYPDTVPVWQVVGALIFIICISIFVLYRLKQHAYLAVGWFWFMGTLVPVSGMLQAGLWPAMADRWAYVPLIGLFIMIAWGGDEIVNRWRLKRTPVACTSLAILMTLIMVSRIQVGYWADSITIFKHAIAATGGSWVAHNNLGRALTDLGDEAQAIQHYSAALRHNPNSAHIHVNFGSALLAQGKIDEAADHFEHALKLDPNFAEAYNNLGLARVRRGHIEDAVYLFSIAVQKNSYHSNARQNLKLAVSIQEKINGAVKRMRQSLKIDLAESDMDLKMVELSENKRDLIKTVKNLQSALSRQPGFIRLGENNIAAVSTVMKEYEGLLPLFLKMAEIQPGSADTNYHIACLYSRKGMVEESIKWLNKALTNDPSRREFFLADPDLENMNQYPLKS